MHGFRCSCFLNPAPLFLAPCFSPLFQPFHRHSHRHRPSLSLRVIAHFSVSASFHSSLAPSLPLPKPCRAFFPPFLPPILHLPSTLILPPPSPRFPFCSQAHPWILSRIDNMQVLSGANHMTHHQPLSPILRLPRFDSVPETVLEHIFGFLQDARDRSAISLVCKEWYSVDRRTRKAVTIAVCYSITPASLTRRFTALESVKIKGKPRAAMFDLVPDDWGGFANPWISAISVHCRLLRSVHLRRMFVTDDDLLTLAKHRGHMLKVLKLDKCSGFTTRGLEAIATSCRSLAVLFLEDSFIGGGDGHRWLHELSLCNSSLEVLNITGTELSSVDLEDLCVMATNCKSLVSLKLNETKLEMLNEIFKRTKALKELGGIVVGDFQPGDHPGETVRLPDTITSLVNLYNYSTNEGDDIVNSIIHPIAPGLKKIDLQYACLSIDGHCQLLSRCANLEALEVFNAIGDEGLEVIADNCKNLRWLRVERGDRDIQQGFVTQKGIISVASNCHQLEYIAAYVSDINNAALTTIATNCPKLKDFRLVLLDEESEISEYPLDEGVGNLMRGCPNLHRFGLYLRPGFLTDKGMEIIGKYGLNLTWVLFGLLGETDNGLKLFANGCPNLQRLEIRDCVFTEKAITESIFKLKNLKYVWIQGYKSTGTGRDLMPLIHDFWNVELLKDPNPPRPNVPPQFLAYRCLAGKRNDAPPSVTCLG